MRGISKSGGEKKKEVGANRTGANELMRFAQTWLIIMLMMVETVNR